MQHVLGGRFAQQIICKDVDFRCVCVAGDEGHRSAG